MRMTSALTREPGWRQEQEFLYRLAPRLTGAANFHSITDRLFTQAKCLLASDYEFLLLANAEGSVLRGLAARGMDVDSFQQEHIEASRELSSVALAFQKRQPVAVLDFTSNVLVGERLRKQYPFLKSLWILPLLQGERAVGVLGIGYTTHREISPQQFGFLQRLKDEATRAVAPTLLTGMLLERYEQGPPPCGRGSGPRQLVARKTTVPHDSQKPVAVMDWGSQGNQHRGLLSTSAGLLDTTESIQKEQRQADFLSTLAHDIRNPLGVIMGYTEMLIEQAQERGVSEGTDLLERIKNSALTVHGLVSNYLDFSRSEAGRLTITKQPLVLNEVLSRVGRLYEADARRRGVTLEFQLQPELPTIDGDALALERVFANLIHNALKFTPASGRVTVSSTSQDDTVLATVADTGPGIAPEELPFLFEKYRRAKYPTCQEGTGLGLFIVKSLVGAHGGQVEVHSILGEGTCFRVILASSVHT
jgi:signal transduction histidine kinase